jgi:hypothetical protein
LAGYIRARTPSGLSLQDSGRGKAQVKPIRWSAHAVENLANREIPRAEAELALADPERLEPGRPHRTVYMRRYFDVRLEQEMLVRAVVEETQDERVVTTVYITSKIGKYMKGAKP